MQAVKILLLLTAYASSVMAKLTWNFAQKNGVFPNSTNAKAIGERMDAATQYYDYYGTTPDIAIQVAFLKTEKTISADRKTSTLTFGLNHEYWQSWWMIHEISHLLGVGKSSIWKKACDDQNHLNFKSATKLLQKFDGPGTLLTCDEYNFRPYGLNTVDEFDDLHAMRHVQLVFSMIEDGLRGPKKSGEPVNSQEDAVFEAPQ